MRRCESLATEMSPSFGTINPLAASSMLSTALPPRRR
jgi:hypothetical protein